MGGASSCTTADERGRPNPARRLGLHPVTTGLGLEPTGVELTERGFVRVDDHLRTPTARGIYAAGDVARDGFTRLLERLPRPARPLRR